MTIWQRDELGVCREGGPVGGDIQASDQWAVCFEAVDEPADGLHARVTSYWFVDNYQDADEEPRTYGIQNVTEYLICDQRDSEVWSDYEYDTDDAREFDTLEAAEQAAERMARTELSTGGQHIAWDGRTIR